MPVAASVDHLGTLEVFVQAIKHARHFIFMENQYYRDPDLADALVDALNKNPSLQLIMVLPFFSQEELALAGVKQIAAYSTWQAQGAVQGAPRSRPRDRPNSRVSAQMADDLCDR